MAVKNMKPEDMQKIAIPSAMENDAGSRKNLKKRPAKLVQVQDAVDKLNEDANTESGEEPLSMKMARLRKEGRLLDQKGNPVGGAIVVEEPVKPEELGNLPEPQGQEQPKAKAEAEAAIHYVEKVRTIEVPSEKDKFLESRTRVTIELADGTFSIPAICVRESKYSVLVLIPLKDDAVSFVPKPGTQLSLAWSGSYADAYFPGSYVEMPELECGVMSFIKAE